MYEDKVTMGKVRSAVEVRAEGDNGAKSRVGAEKRDSDRWGESGWQSGFCTKTEA